MGAYHTLDLEVNRKFSLSKEEWDSVSLERVDTACDPTQVLLHLTIEVLEYSSLVQRNFDSLCRTFLEKSLTTYFISNSLIFLYLANLIKMRP